MSSNNEDNSLALYYLAMLTYSLPSLVLGAREFPAFLARFTETIVTYILILANLVKVTLGAAE